MGALLRFPFLEDHKAFFYSLVFQYALSAIKETWGERETQGKTKRVQAPASIEHVAGNRAAIPFVYLSMACRLSYCFPFTCGYGGRLRDSSIEWASELPIFFLPSFPIDYRSRLSASERFLVLFHLLDPCCVCPFLALLFLPP